MAIGRTEDRNTPGNSLGHKPRRDVRGPIRVTHLGPRSTQPHTKAGHMTAIDQTRPSCKNPCEAGAVHTWVSLRSTHPTGYLPRTAYAAKKKSEMAASTM